MPVRRGVWFFLVVLAFLGTVVLFAALRLRSPLVEVAGGTVLVFDVPADLDEAEIPLRPFSFGLVRRGQTTLYELVRGLRHAAEDDRVAALVLHVDEIDWGWAKLAEVREAIQYFQASGKPVIASLSGGAEAEYLLASAADLVAVPPATVLQLNGLSASVLFYRGTFDKLDIRPNFAHSGLYKAGVEPYTLSSLSPASRAALESLLDAQYALLLDSLATARGLPADSVRALLDRGPFVSGAALAAGLVDTLLDRVETDSMARDAVGGEPSTLSLTRYLQRIPAARRGPRIALVTAVGTIGPGKSHYLPGEGLTLGSETLIEALRQARSRRSIRAIVLRIDSPGGQIDAADDIWREVRRCREVKPVVASMSDLAASGGYYIAAGTDRIVARPSTVTGSIGVYGGKLNLLGLYRKLGLNVETLSRGRHAEMLSPFHDFTEEEARRFQRQMDDAYDLFLERVADGRGMSRAAADSAGQGRVWGGLAALDLGLVDTLGGIDDAFRAALAEAGYAPEAEYVVEPFPKVERSFLERLVEAWWPGDEEALGLERTRALPPVLRSWLAASRFPAGTAQALMPFSIEIR